MKCGSGKERKERRDCASEMKILRKKDGVKELKKRNERIDGKGKNCKEEKGEIEKR